MTTYDVNRRNKVLRAAELARYDEETVHAIIDAAFVGHVAYAIEGQPYAMPTLIARDGGDLLLHGHAKSRTLLHAGAGHPICVTVTHTDGLILARSTFNSSIAYRSALVFGTGRLVTGRDEKLAALERFTEKLLPGRWADSRPTTELELKATAVVALTIESASAKISHGFPEDPAEDQALPFWGGVVPLRSVLDAPLPDEHVPAGMEPPAYLLDYIARFNATVVDPTGRE